MSPPCGSTAEACTSSTPWPRSGAGPPGPWPARPSGPSCRPLLLPDMTAAERFHAMRTAPDQPSNERTNCPVPTTGVAHTTPLAALSRVPWGEIQDSTGCASAIPLLLNSVAWGDRETADAALGDLRRRICQYGFVVEQATAATVPFLWELAQLPQVT